MANLVKTKATLSAVSILILIMIPLLETGFMRPVVLKRWTALTWDDFQGISKPFSKYDAGIHSDIYLEYDSSLKRYHAYAAQNNVQSWVNEVDTSRAGDILLDHEQYHFNITEAFSRIADSAIVRNVLDDRFDHMSTVANVNYDMRVMQYDYDWQTRHGTLLHRQKRWEFKIDSMLAGRKGWLIDEFSGASIFLPAVTTPTLRNYVTNKHVKSRNYTLSSYEMDFRLLSMQHQLYDDSVMLRVIKSIKEGRGETILKVDSTENSQRIYSRSVDSKGWKTYASWIYTNAKLYYTSASFLGSSDTTGYYEIAQSVIQSFKISDIEDDVVFDVPDVPDESSYSTLRKVKAPGNSQCYISTGSMPVGFISKPIFDEDGGAYFSCDFSAAPDSLRFSDFLIVDHEMASEKPDNKGQQFYVNASSVSRGAHVMVGYLLKEDTTKKCFRMFREHVDLRR